MSTAALCAPSDDLQGRRFFDSFDRYDRASVCNANNAGQHLSKKPIEFIKVGNRHLEQIVEVTGYETTVDYLLASEHCRLKAL